MVERDEARVREREKRHRKPRAEHAAYERARRARPEVRDRLRERAADRFATMTQDERDRMRRYARRYYRDLTPEQREARRLRQNEARRRRMEALKTDPIAYEAFLASVREGRRRRRLEQIMREIADDTTGHDD